MTKFKGDPDGAQILHAAVSDLRIYYRNAIRQFGLRFMVIQHDHVDATSFELGDFSHRRGAAVNRDEQLRVMLFETTLDAFPAQSIALLHTQRQKQLWRAAVSPQNFIE